MTDDSQTTAEALDSDEIGEDPTGALQFPPERPLGLSDPDGLDGTLDSPEERYAREEPDVDQVGAKVSDSPVGHLLAPGDVLDDEESDLIATGAEDEGVEDFSAEEAAMHVATDPAYSEGDSYLDK